MAYASEVLLVTVPASQLDAARRWIWSSMLLILTGYGGLWQLKAARHAHAISISSWWQQGLALPSQTHMVAQIVIFGERDNYIC